MAKLTVNGVTYESVDAMPPEVRRVYDQALAKFPSLADRDGNGIPDVVQGEGPSVRHAMTVRKTFIVNGTTYDDESAMPHDVRQAYDEAMRRVGAGGPTLTKNEIKLSFQLTGPGFSFHTDAGAPSRSQPINHATSPDAAPQPVVGTPMPSPIEPASFGGVFRIALILGACVTGSLMLWLLMRAH